jgi:acetyl-CoA carboxylase biotin carboxyl carrier protein
VDYTQIEALATVLNESTTLTELEVRQGDLRLRLRRPTPKPRPRPKVVASVNNRATGMGTPLPSPASLLPATETITAGYVGIFHNARKGPVTVGDSIAAEQVLGHIETMRLLNDCVATVSGRLQAILVMDGQPVEYGQPLFEIVPEET